MRFRKVQILFLVFVLFSAIVAVGGEGRGYAARMNEALPGIIIATAAFFLVLLLMVFVIVRKRSEYAAKTNEAAAKPKKEERVWERVVETVENTQNDVPQNEAPQDEADLPVNPTARYLLKIGFPRDIILELREGPRSKCFVDESLMVYFYEDGVTVAWKNRFDHALYLAGIEPKPAEERSASQTVVSS